MLETVCSLKIKKKEQKTQFLSLRKLLYRSVSTIYKYVYQQNQVKMGQINDKLSDFDADYQN